MLRLRGVDLKKLVPARKRPPFTITEPQPTRKKKPRLLFKAVYEEYYRLVFEMLLKTEMRHSSHVETSIYKNGNQEANTSFTTRSLIAFLKPL